VADFNGDGAPDVLNDNAYEPSVYLNIGAVKFALSASASKVAQGSTVTLTAALQPTVSQNTPGGTVSFFANSNLLGTSPVQGGQASLDTANLEPGNYTITAKYSGDANFNTASASTSVAITVSSLTPDFSITGPTPASLSLVSGQAGTVTLTLTGNATFSSTVTLDCAGGTSSLQCLVSPASLTLIPGQTSTITVAVATRGSGTAKAMNAAPKWSGVNGGLSLASLFLLAWSGKKRKALSAWFALLLVVFASLTATGCGGNSSDGYTPAGSYSLTITATTGSLSHSQTVPVTVASSK